MPGRWLCRATAALAVAALAGCGGSGGDKTAWRAVKLPPFRFEVPAGWTESRQPSRAVWKHGSDFVQAASFPLVHPYTDDLFAKVEPELAARMETVAKKTGGTIGGSRTVTAGGIESHAYDVKVGGRTDTYTFVLRGPRELQLICSAKPAVCDRLLSSLEVR